MIMKYSRLGARPVTPVGALPVVGDSINWALAETLEWPYRLRQYRRSPTLQPPATSPD
jgi:hypothetical protein